MVAAKNLRKIKIYICGKPKDDVALARSGILCYNIILFVNIMNSAKRS
jgi:hypothetical protein